MSDTPDRRLAAPFAIFEYLVSRPQGLDGTPLFAEGTSTSRETPPLDHGSQRRLVLGMLSTADSTTHRRESASVMQERVPSMGTKLSVEDQIQASAGSITATGASGSSQSWAALVAAFRAGPSGAATVGQWSAVQNWPVVAVTRQPASDREGARLDGLHDQQRRTGLDARHRQFHAQNYATTSLFCSGRVPPRTSAS